MTRAEHYASGFSEGCRWAERDLRDGRGLTHDREAELRDDATLALYWTHQGEPYAQEAAWRLGAARGYRQTVARFEAGTLSFEEFEQAPL